MTEEKEIIEEPKASTYKQLLAQVAVLSKMLNAHAEGKGRFDQTGVLTQAILKDVPKVAEELIRKNQRMEYTLTRVKQGFYNLINAEALPSEGWDYAVRELIDTIEKTLEMIDEEGSILDKIEAVWTDENGNPVEEDHR